MADPIVPFKTAPDFGLTDPAQKRERARTVAGTVLRLMDEQIAACIAQGMSHLEFARHIDEWAQQYLADHPELSTPSDKWQTIENCPRTAKAHYLTRLKKYQRLEKNRLAVPSLNKLPEIDSIEPLEILLTILESGKTSTQISAAQTLLAQYPKPSQDPESPRQRALTKMRCIATSTEAVDHDRQRAAALLLKYEQATQQEARSLSPEEIQSASERAAVKYQAKLAAAKKLGA